MLIKNLKKIKKVRIPSSCSFCNVKDSDYWYIVLACLTPTETIEYKSSDSLTPVLGRTKHYVFCSDCSKRYNGCTIDHQIYIRKNMDLKSVDCNCSSGGQYYV